MRYGHVARRSAADRPAYSELKALWSVTVASYAKKQGLPARGARWRYPISLSWRFFERDAHRDPDGIAAGARKLILDALVPCKKGCDCGGGKHAGVLPSDGHRHVKRSRWEEFYIGFETERGVLVEGVTVGFYEGERFVDRLAVPLLLPDLNELLAARELGARRMVHR